MARVDLDEIRKRTTYVPPDEHRVSLHGAIRLAMSQAMAVVVASTPESREQSLALTKIEEAMFWANAAIARNVE